MAKKIVKKEASKSAKKDKKSAAATKKKATIKLKKVAPKKAAKKAVAPKVASKVTAKAPAKTAAASKKVAPKAGETKKAEKVKPIAKANGEAVAKQKAAEPAPAKRAKEREFEAEIEIEPIDESVADEAVVELEEKEAAGLEDGGDSEEIILTDAEGRRYCRVKDCDQLASVDGYCRFHYLLFWKRIQIRKKILSEGKLERYIEELTARYPDKFLDMLRKDLRSEKEFLAAIQELEIDESAVDNEFEDETQTYIEEVRGMGESGGGARDEEDF